MQITEYNSFLCGLLAGITYGVYRPRYVEITATVHGEAPAAQGGNQ